MGFITLKSLTVSMLVASAISTSAVPAAVPQIGNAVNTFGIVSDATALKAEAKIAPGISDKASVKPMSETTQVTQTQAISAKITSPDKLDLWIDKLIQKESNGRTDLKVLDTNGQYSYGCLQFQMPTFVAFGRKYGVVNGKEDNLGSLIMNCSIQKILAKKMILSDGDSWRNWYTSVAVKNLGLPPVN